MGYRSDSIAASCDMGPLRAVRWENALSTKCEHPPFQIPPFRPSTQKRFEWKSGYFVLAFAFVLARQRQANSPRGKRIPILVLGLPKHFYGGKITSTNDFADFSRKIIWTKGLTSVLHCRYWYEDLISRPLIFFGICSRNGHVGHTDRPQQQATLMKTCKIPEISFRFRFCSSTEGIKNLLMPLFLMGCFPGDFEEGERPIKAFRETAY